MTIAELNDETRAQFEIADGVNGVVIVEVDPNSAAADKGIAAGDVITEIAQETVTSPKDVMDRIGALRGQGRKNALLMLSSRTGELRFETVRMN
jgi:serine protease Do